MRILIADDSAVVRKVLRRAIEANGWMVCCEAENGRAAVEQVKKCAPDLVLLDFSMPEMNGLDAARAISTLHPTLPIFMFTNYGSDFLNTEARTVGMQHVITKAETNTLLRTIDAVSQQIQEPPPLAIIEKPATNPAPQPSIPIPDPKEQK